MLVKLTVVRGKPVGKVVRLARGEYVLGRDEACQLRVHSRTASRRHCALRVAEDHVWVRDLGSTHGTLVNGARITHETRLQNMDLVQVGSLALRFGLEDALDDLAPCVILSSSGTASDSAILDAPPVVRQESKTDEHVPVIFPA